MKQIARHSLFLVLIVALLAMVSCTTDDDPSIPLPTDLDLPEPDDQSEGPSVEITSPAEGDSVPAGDVEVAIAVSDFDIVDKLGEAPAEGEGHIHYYRNVDQVPTTPGEPAVTDDDSTYHAGAGESHTWTDVEPGTHVFAVQLVNNDHTPLEPPVVTEVTVTAN